MGKGPGVFTVSDEMRNLGRDVHRTQRWGRGLEKGPRSHSTLSGEP